jgi:Icc-related predicted phosphoesterase
MTTILIVTDLHDRQSTLEPFAAAIERHRPNAIFCLGDLTERVRRAEAFTHEFLEVAEKSGSPICCISGNNDAPKSLEILKQRGHLIDFQERRIPGARVVGLGYHEPEQPYELDLGGALLLTHLPPRRNSVPPTVTQLPRFHFSGHFHKSERIWRLRETTVVQVPSAMLGRGALLYLPRGHVEFIDLV